MNSEVWGFLRHAAERRGYAPGDKMRTPLLGPVACRYANEAKTVSESLIPHHLSREAEANGFRIIEADWRDDTYLLEILP